jgi:NAD(P)-dependent dehydrogenase (short-subunit alcohol dehydrogenase family)
VILVSSINAMIGATSEGCYAAVKGSLHSFCRVLACEVAESGVRANVVVPGTVRTRGRNSLKRLEKNGRYFEDVGRVLVPIGRVVEPREVAALNLFLATDESASISGQPFVIDGGVTAAGGPLWLLGPNWPDKVEFFRRFLDETDNFLIPSDKGIVVT